MASSPQSPWDGASPFIENNNFGKYCCKAFRECRRERDVRAPGSLAGSAGILPATGVPPGLYLWFQYLMTTAPHAEPLSFKKSFRREGPEGTEALWGCLGVTEVVLGSLQVFLFMIC
jgi:hypothetical protein